MNRRKAIGGILAFTGISIASFTGYNFFYGTSNRGKLKNYKDLIAELADVIIPPSDTPGAKEANVHDFIINFMESCSSNKEFNTFFKKNKRLHVKTRNIQCRINALHLT